MKPKKKSTRPSAKTARSPARPRRRPKAAPGKRANGTELRRVQEALQARTAELETLMREAPMPIFVGHDAACRVITGNPAARKLVRAHAEENISVSVPGIGYEIHRDGRAVPHAELPVQRAAATGQAVPDADWEVVFADGERRHILGNAVPLFDERGVPRGSIGTFIDITGRVRAETALRESEARLKLALDAAQMGSWDWNMISGEILWTPMHEVLFGYEPGRPSRIYRDFSDRVHPEDLPQVEALVRASIETGSDFRSEFRIVWPDGSIHWMSGFGRFHFDALRRPVRMLGTVVEVTGRKQADAEIYDLNIALENRVRERTAALRGANRELVLEIAERQRLEAEVLKISEHERRQFGQELHDDICQQLSGIGMMSQALARRMRQTNPAEAAEADRFSALLGQALADTRALARGLHPVEVDSKGLMAALDELATQTSHRLPCRLVCPKPVLLADSQAALHLYRIAQEAVTNALKHARTSEIVLALRLKSGRIVLSIRDDGTGLPKTASKGMGLLIMPYRARMAGATLTVRTARGRGTEIVCTLPRPGEG